MALPMVTLGQSSYEEQPIRENTFSKKNWKKTTRNLDYSGNASTKKNAETKGELNSEALEETDGRRGDEQQEYSEPGWINRSMFEGSQALKFIFFAIAILALVFVIWKIVQAQMKLRNPKVRKRAETLEEVVENIHETDLERFLREALAADNYKLAIRVYYLMIIKELSNKKLIKWKKDKTNNIYIREMRQTEYYKKFRDLTRKFERTWFGEDEIQKVDFQKLQPQFEGFVTSIK